MRRTLIFCFSATVLSAGCTQDGSSGADPSATRSVSAAKDLAEAEWALAPLEKRTELCRVYRQQGEGGLRILPKTGLFSVNDRAVEEWIKIVARECGTR